MKIILVFFLAFFAISIAHAQSGVSDCPNIVSYGGSGNGTTDNLPAWNAALAAQASLGKACVFFPPGTFKFSAQAVDTLPTAGSSVSVIGSGADVTNITWPNASGGFLINYSSPGNSAHFRDMTVSTGAVNGGNGINLTQTNCLNDFAQSDIHRVTFRGFDNNAGAGGSDYWGRAYLINGVSGTSVDTVTVYGAGSGSTHYGAGGVYQGNGTCYSIYHNISKSTFNVLSIGIEYLSYSQGITVTQTNIQNTDTGFYTPAGQTGALSQLQISDSQFATTSNGIVLLTNIGNVMIHDNDLFCHVGASCIFIDSPEGFSIVGNNIDSDGSGSAIGIAIAKPYVPGQVGTITGNVMGGLNIGVYLETGSSGVNVQSNAYVANTTNVDNLGTGNTIGGGSQ